MERKSDQIDCVFVEKKDIDPQPPSPWSALAFRNGVQSSAALSTKFY